MRGVRGVLGVIAGLILISLIVEPVEMALVTMQGGSLADPESYLSVRNQTWFLGVKFAYNFIGGMAGGALAAWIAQRAPIWHGAALAALQSALLVWAMTNPDMGPTAPMWAWLGFIAATGLGVLAGAALIKPRRKA